MICPKCGTQNPDGTKFCSGCGTPLASDAAPMDATRVQPTPAQPQPQPAAAPSSYQPVPAPQPPAPKSGSGKTIAIVVLAVLLVAAIAAVVYFVVVPQLSGNQQDAASQPALEQPEQTDDAEPEATPDTDATDDTATPDTTTPTTATTLEEVLRASGEYDSACQELESTMMQSGEGAITDIEARISGNDVYVAAMLDMASDDPQAVQMAQTIMAYFAGDDAEAMMAQTCAQFEEESGLSGVSMTFDLYTSDSVNFGYVTYGADGIIATESAV